MNWIFTTLVVLIVLASVLLTLVVLLQNGKGDGLASNFVSANQTLGVRQTADILEKFSWYLVTFILVLSIVSSFTLGSRFPWRPRLSELTFCQRKSYWNRVWTIAG